jgi:hypothetical protein
MVHAQHIFIGDLDQYHLSDHFNHDHYDWVLVFGNRMLLEQDKNQKIISDFFKGAIISGGTTSGEFSGSSVDENTIFITAIQFKSTQLIQKSVNLSDFPTSRDAGKSLISSFPEEGLKHIFIISDGTLVNGSQLVEGMNQALGNQVTLSGGLAGDAGLFEKTLVTNEQGHWLSCIITGIAFYGSIEVSCGSAGGWTSFGMEKTISKSKSNVLYEIDGQPALSMYKNLLGDRAKELPGAALLFPLLLTSPNKKEPLVRTILGLNEEDQSLTFAGDMPVGSTVRLMKSNNENLVMGAHDACLAAMDHLSDSPQLAILVSCVGRKLVLKESVYREVDAIRNFFDQKRNVVLTGFYSYGEIAPYYSTMDCELHNQTMTVTLLREF